jgi:hypothetical protein
MGNWVPKSKEESLINEMNNSNKVLKKEGNYLVEKRDLQKPLFTH